VCRAEVDEGWRPGRAAEERARLKELSVRTRELRRAIEILQFAPRTFRAAKARPVSAGDLRDDALRRKDLAGVSRELRVYDADRVWAQLNRRPVESRTARSNG
jgi:hypothetical protein